MRLLSLKLILSLLFFLFFSWPVFAQQPTFTTPPTYQITTGIQGTPVPLRGYTFLVVNADIDYQGGKVMLSSNPDGTGNTFVDDAIDIFSVSPSGSLTRIFQHVYNAQCRPLESLPPLDLGHIFKQGVNHIRFRLFDTCGTNMASSPLYLVTENLAPSPTPSPSTSPSPSPSPSGPEPFLDLPWDYRSSGMTFNDSAISINSFFDHEYPFLSTDLKEPPDRSKDLINYKGVRSDRFFYSSHDGYDYGTPAKTKLGTPVLAPSEGEATFMNSCAPCGNAILIDHKNGFQTRYYHLQSEGLIVNLQGVKVNVSKRAANR